MGLFDGTTSLYDHERDQDLSNWISFDVRHDRVIFMIGGGRLLSRPQVIEVTHPAIVQLMARIVAILRVEAYRQRKITPVPKGGGPSRSKPGGLPEWVCPRCQGAGEYQWGDSLWKACPDCDGTGRRDRGLRPDDEG